MLSKQLRLDPAQLTDVGRKRPHNEDNMAYVIPKDPVVMAKKGALFIVADGMGGHAAGEVASEIAVDTVSKVYYLDDSDDVATSLVQSVKRANTLIYQRAAENMLRSGMGTTCVTAVLRGGTAYITNVGDSRAYLIHNGQVRQVSQDHSWVAEQVRAGFLTEEQARSHSQRNVITRSLGTQPEVEVDIFIEQLEEGDFIVLCSDGLSGLVSDDDLRTIVSQYQPQESVYHLVERANENGGPDNITVIVARVQEVGWEPQTPRLGNKTTAFRRDVADEETMPMGFAGAALGIPTRAEDGQGRVTTSPLNRSTGPLGANENFSSPSALPARKKRRGHPLYLVMLLVVVFALLGIGGYYYLTQNNGSSTDATLSNARKLLTLAQNEAIANPTDALSKLAEAKKQLSGLSTSALSQSQNQQMTTLQSSLIATTKTAITSYNTQSNIVALPCNSTITTPLNNGNTNTHANTLAAVTNQKNNVFLYGLGDDGFLYQINSSQSLVNQLSILPGILKINSDGSRILALVLQKGAYSVHLLLPNQQGQLQDTNAININSNQAQVAATPSFVTAWGPDVYVVLTSATAATQNQAFIQSYTVTADNKLMMQGALTKISISSDIVSVAAFPSHQLFLAYSNGSIQSLMSGSQTGVSVVVNHPIPTPLQASAQTFTTATPVPQVIGPASVFLTLSHAPLLVAGSVNKVPHLYVVDLFYHRVLDLQEAASVPATPVATPSPTQTSGSSSGSGGGIASSSSQVTMQLMQQYASPSLLSQVVGAVADPLNVQLHLLTETNQNGVVQSLIGLDVNAQDTCTPAP